MGFLKKMLNAAFFAIVSCNTNSICPFSRSLKGIVSRDFGGLQVISMDRIVVPDVPLEVYSFLNFRFQIVFLIFRFRAG